MQIDKKEWETCYLCGLSIRDIKKQFGGSNKYDSHAMKTHIENHGLSTEEYFEKITSRPKCPCGICDKSCDITTRQQGKTGFFWKKYACGRNDACIEWSKRAKNSRKGSGNPMFGKKPWNFGLTKNTNHSVMECAQKRIGIKASEYTKKKQSESAKKRITHGHSGHFHSEESKEKMRIATLNRIKNGDFKQTKTKPHIEMSKILDFMNIQYEEETIVDVWCFDFYIPTWNLYIEVDGDYFHSNPRIYPNGPITKTQKINHCRDMKKNKYTEENKMILLRVWESEILSDPWNVYNRIKKYEI